jgi:hypothetical protein
MKIAPCSIILIWDFIGAYAMPHISKNALNISRANSGILRETSWYIFLKLVKERKYRRKRIEHGS